MCVVLCCGEQTKLVLPSCSTLILLLLLFFSSLYYIVFAVVVPCDVGEFKQSHLDKIT